MKYKFENWKPDIVEIKEKCGNKYRFLLKKNGKQNLLVLGMNPSKANKDQSDTTVNRIIDTITKHPKQKYDSYTILNVYPIYETTVSNDFSIDNEIEKENIEIIVNEISKNPLKEIWLACGNCEQFNTTWLKIQEKLKSINIKCYCFGVTDRKPYNPLHPCRKPNSLFDWNNWMTWTEHKTIKKRMINEY